MPHCRNCNNLKTRLDNNNLCQTCMESYNAEMTSNETTNDSNTTDKELSSELLNSSLSDINVQQLIEIINKINKPIKDDLDKLRSGVISKVTTLENKVLLLVTSIQFNVFW